MKKALLFLGVLLLPSICFAAAPRTFVELASYLVFIMNNMVAVLIVLGLVVYFWGVTSNIHSMGSEDGAEARKNYFFWGIVALFVMVSVWGILRLLQNTLFGGGGGIGSGQQAPSNFCASFGECGE